LPDICKKEQKGRENEDEKKNENKDGKMMLKRGRLMITMRI
jgi:hypothetical protein